MVDPSGWVMYAAAASRANDGPVMPGAAACAALASSETAAIAATRRICRTKVFVFMARSSALLLEACFGRRIDRSADVDLGHQPAEVLGVVGQMIEIGRVQIEFLARRIARSVQAHVERFATGERDRVRKVSHVVASHIAQQARVEANDTHRNAE